MSDLPRYADLPVAEGMPPRSSWGLWGEGDRFGCLNLLTPERVLGGAAEVRKGSVFALNLDLELPDPPLFGRKAFEHAVHWLQGEVGHDDELSGWNTQSSSQWDGFRHIRHATHGFYGGVADEDHGIHHWARRGIAGRALLADVGRWRAAQGRPLDCREAEPIDSADLLATIEAQGTPVQAGDVLLVRTGWVGWYRDLDASGRAALATDLRAPGLRPGEEMLATLWDLHISAIGADNPSVEVWPPGSAATPEQVAAAGDPDRRSDLFMHFALLPLLGLPLGEMWDLEALAADCAEDGVYSCLFTSAPINLRAGVASPPNALAIK